MPTDTLERLRAELTCPFTIEVAEDPVISPCCGRIFDRVAVIRHAATHEAISFQCPCCKLPIRKAWINSQPRGGALRNIAETMRNNFLAREKET
jgi:hypothetical protein